MQIMLDTTHYSDREPRMLRALAVFLVAMADAETTSVDNAKYGGESAINEPVDRDDDIPLHTEVKASQIFENMDIDRMTLLPRVAPPAPLPPDVEVDAEGKTWDAALHSSSRKKTIDGKWKLFHKRGNAAEVTPVTETVKVAGVVTQLHNLPAAIAALKADASMPPVPLPPNLPPPPAVEDDEAPAPPPPAPLPSVAAGIDFPTFISKITAGMNTGTVTQSAMDVAMKKYGIDSLFSLNTPDAARPTLLADVSREFGFL